MPTNKLLVSVYNRIVELMELIPPLLAVQTLPDTLVLQVINCPRLWQFCGILYIFSLRKHTTSALIPLLKPFYLYGWRYIKLHWLTSTTPTQVKTTVQISTLSVSPFFVENVGTLQLSALSVCRGIFCLYEKHRQIILDDIFSSLARLPSSKRNFRR